MATTYHWASVYRNTNLLLKHLPKLKPHSHTKTHVHFYYFLSIYPLLKIFPDLKLFSLILAENTLFFSDFPDWKKFSKCSLFSLISLIGGNPVKSILMTNLKLLFVVIYLNICTTNNSSINTKRVSSPVFHPTTQYIYFFKMN